MHDSGYDLERVIRGEFALSTWEVDITALRISVLRFWEHLEPQACATTVIEAVSVFRVATDRVTGVV